MVSCLRQKRLACCPFWRSRNPLGLLHVLIDQSTLSENLSDLANSPPSLIHTVCMAGHQSQVQWGAWDGPGSRVVGGACTLVDVLTRSGLPRQSSENTKAKRHSRSIIQKGPAKFWRVVVQTRLPMCPGPRSTRDRVSRGIATYRLWESRRPKGWFSKQI